MSAHNICFHGEIRKLLHEYSCLYGALELIFPTCISPRKYMFLVVVRILPHMLYGETVAALIITYNIFSWRIFWPITLASETQLEARPTGDHEVVGSNPARSATFFHGD